MLHPRTLESDLEYKKIHERITIGENKLSNEVTIVTAYFNIGSLNKGGPFGVYTPKRYTEWMTVFGRLDNPLIVFTDTEDVAAIFRSIRSHFDPGRTQVHVTKWDSLWAFGLAKEIKAVFSQPFYPHIDPNTINENYSCVMHAKFELVNRVLTAKMYRTQYVAWMDIGLFRAVVGERHIFSLFLPPGFDHNKIAYSGQGAFDPTSTPIQIVRGNAVWVGGAMFLGVPDILYLYTKDYMHAVRQLLDIGVMSTDQQVIYIMYLPSFEFEPRVQLQTYSRNSFDDWFYLGYLLKDAWDTTLRRKEPTICIFSSFII